MQMIKKYITGMGKEGFRPPGKCKGGTTETNDTEAGGEEREHKKEEGIIFTRSAGVGSRRDKTVVVEKGLFDN